MPANQFLLRIPARTTRRWIFALYEADETEFGLASDDECRFKIWQTSDATPDLDLSATATDNGSVIEVLSTGTQGSSAATVRLTLAQDDVASLSGRYNAELAWVNNSQTFPADAYYPVCRGLVIVQPSPTGDRGLAS